jgi:hypothetical protein
VRLVRVLHRLLRVFVAGLVLAFCVTRRRRTVGVRGLFVQFRGSLMRIVFHGLLSLTATQMLRPRTENSHRLCVG